MLSMLLLTVHCTFPSCSLHVPYYRGLFSNKKWKDKLLVVTAGSSVYFNACDESAEDNTADRSISLLWASVKDVADIDRRNNGPAHQVNNPKP